MHFNFNYKIKETITRSKKLTHNKSETYHIFKITLLLHTMWNRAGRLKIYAKN